MPREEVCSKVIAGPKQGRTGAQNRSPMVLKQEVQQDEKPAVLDQACYPRDS